MVYVHHGILSAMKLWRHTITWMDLKGIINNNCQIIDNNLSNYFQIDKKSTSKSQILYDSLCIIFSK